MAFGFRTAFLMTLVACLATSGASRASAAASEPVVEVKSISTPGGEATRVSAVIEIDAGPAAVWAVLTDCARAPQIIPHLESCRIIDSDVAGRWDIREHIINPPLLPRIRTLVRNDFQIPRRLAFKLQGGDMRVSDGAWALQPLNGGTRLSYEAVIAPKFAAPQFLITRAMAQDFPAMLKAIQRASAP
jgi:hypothetical protein